MERLYYPQSKLGFPPEIAGLLKEFLATIFKAGYYTLVSGGG